ncbi:putative TATA-binding protein interacting (TIP20) [Monocercomonoides exilis]|uniref:putative TATA-binding protein interacting (TIP20) n=1 Tax=Monocercomonoides exilis TaxID=2049356 RepID=UPI00355AC90E|nr:putative TATA-binding protein interacting (TIP20) [Monocercomonoides exilis]|eukprot:MONOS_2774.1-p1 / transcript=MONOS_2774.1 / gene=MONOS_2774 / organism=Monocercomonoides_exilis_PA203 / gene_product=unspecified product / transcript_product=unspecified product / location=Mono_scaffold00059:80033-85784(+) / protein_length=1697 / sequence_SO=supercontig / SO=protein_coding / is_pseudo=false
MNLSGSLRVTLDRIKNVDPDIQEQGLIDLQKLMDQKDFHLNGYEESITLAVVERGQQASTVQSVSFNCLGRLVALGLQDEVLKQVMESYLNALNAVTPERRPIGAAALKIVIDQSHQHSTKIIVNTLFKPLIAQLKQEQTEIYCLDLLADFSRRFGGNLGNAQDVLVKELLACLESSSQNTKKKALQAIFALAPHLHTHLLKSVIEQNTEAIKASDKNHLPLIKIKLIANITTSAGAIVEPFVSRLVETFVTVIPSLGEGQQSEEVRLHCLEALNAILHIIGKRKRFTGIGANKVEDGSASAKENEKTNEENRKKWVEGILSVVVMSLSFDPVYGEEEDDEEEEEEEEEEEINDNDLIEKQLRGSNSEEDLSKMDIEEEKDATEADTDGEEEGDAGSAGLTSQSEEEEEEEEEEKEEEEEGEDEEIVYEEEEEDEDPDDISWRIRREALNAIEIIVNEEIVSLHRIYREIFGRLMKRIKEHTDETLQQLLKVFLLIISQTEEYSTNPRTDCTPLLQEQLLPLIDALVSRLRCPNAETRAFILRVLCALNFAIKKWSAGKYKNKSKNQKNKNKNKNKGKKFNACGLPTAVLKKLVFECRYPFAFGSEETINPQLSTAAFDLISALLQSHSPKKIERVSFGIVLMIRYAVGHTDGTIQAKGLKLAGDLVIAATSGAASFSTEEESLLKLSSGTGLGKEYHPNRVMQHAQELLGMCMDIFTKAVLAEQQVKQSALLSLGIILSRCFAFLPERTQIVPSVIKTIADRMSTETLRNQAANAASQVFANRDISEWISANNSKELTASLDNLCSELCSCVRRRHNPQLALTALNSIFLLFSVPSVAQILSNKSLTDVFESLSPLLCDSNLRFSPSVASTLAVILSSLPSSLPLFLSLGQMHLDAMMFNSHFPSGESDSVAKLRLAIVRAGQLQAEKEKGVEEGEKRKAELLDKQIEEVLFVAQPQPIDIECWKTAANVLARLVVREKKEKQKELFAKLLGWLDEQSEDIPSVLKEDGGSPVPLLALSPSAAGAAMNMLRRQRSMASPPSYSGSEHNGSGKHPMTENVSSSPSPSPSPASSSSAFGSPITFTILPRAVFSLLFFAAIGQEKDISKQIPGLIHKIEEVMTQKRDEENTSGGAVDISLMAASCLGSIAVGAPANFVTQLLERAGEKGDQQMLYLMVVSEFLVKMGEDRTFACDIEEEMDLEVSFDNADKTRMEDDANESAPSPSDSRAAMDGVSAHLEQFFTLLSGVLSSDVQSVRDAAITSIARLCASSPEIIMPRLARLIANTPLRTLKANEQESDSGDEVIDVTEIVETKKEGGRRMRKSQTKASADRNSTKKRNFTVKMDDKPRRLSSVFDPASVTDLGPEPKSSKKSAQHTEQQAAPVAPLTRAGVLEAMQRVIAMDISSVVNMTNTSSLQSAPTLLSSSSSSAGTLAFIPSLSSTSTSFSGMPGLTGTSSSASYELLSMSPTERFEALLSQYLGSFLRLLLDEDLSVQKEAAVLVKMIVLHRPHIGRSILRPYCVGLLSLLVFDPSLRKEQKVFGQSLIVDEGLPSRLAGYDAVEIILEKMSRVIDGWSVMQHLVEGFDKEKDGDVKKRMFSIVGVMCTTHVEAVMANMDAIVKAMDDVLEMKRKKNEDEDDVRTRAESDKNVLRLVMTMERVGKIANHPAFEKVISAKMAQPEWREKYDLLKSEMSDTVF